MEETAEQRHITLRNKTELVVSLQALPVIRERVALVSFAFRTIPAAVAAVMEQGVDRIPIAAMERVAVAFALLRIVPWVVTRVNKIATAAREPVTLMSSFVIKMHQCDVEFS